MSYEFIKTIHIVSVISWMAGLLYLPRIFVYHSNGDNLAETNAVFAVMEYKLLRYIMYPALVLTWVSGLTLAVVGHYYSSAWFQVKFFSVLALTLSHCYFDVCSRRLKAGDFSKSSKFFRVINEVPTLLMIIIVALVVFKPVFR